MRPRGSLWPRRRPIRAPGSCPTSSPWIHIAGRGPPCPRRARAALPRELARAWPARQYLGRRKWWCGEWNSARKRGPAWAGAGRRARARALGTSRTRRPWFEQPRGPRTSPARPGAGAVPLSTRSSARQARAPFRIPCTFFVVLGCGWTHSRSARPGAGPRGSPARCPNWPLRSVGRAS